MSALIASWYGPVLWLLLALWLCASPAALSRLRARLKTAGPGAGSALAFATLLALALRLLLVERGHRVYFDEFEHLDIARALASGHGFTETLAGGLPGWDVRDLPTWPGAHHAALALAFKLCGATAGVAFAWSALLSTLSVPLVYWAALELFEDAGGAMGAALLWALCPLSIAYAGAADLSSSAQFWAAAALAGLAAARSEGSVAPFAALSAALAAQTRFEYGLYAAAAALLLPQARRAWALAPLLPLALPAALVWTNAHRDIPGFSSADAGFLANLRRQLPGDLAFLLAAWRGWAPAAWLGLGASLTRLRAAALAALSAAFLLAYACFFRGDFHHGTEDRYALAILLPLTVAAAAAPRSARSAALLLAAGLVAARQIPRPLSEREDARRFAVKAGSLVPARGVILDFNPSFARETTGRPVAPAWLALSDRARLEKEKDAAGGEPGWWLLEDAAFKLAGDAGPKLKAELAKGLTEETVYETEAGALRRFSPALPARR